MLLGSTFYGKQMVVDQKARIQELVTKEDEAVATMDSQRQEIKKISTEKNDLEFEKKSNEESNKKLLEELNQKITELKSEVDQTEGEEVTFQILEGGTPVYPPQYFSGKGTITNE